MPLCKPSIWFNAVISNDIAVIKRHVRRYRGKHEPRDSNGPIIKGFTALHYAAFQGNLEMFQFLLPHEFNVMTDTTIVKNGFELQSQSSVAHVLMLTENKEIIDYFLNELNNNVRYQIVVGQQNAMGCNATHVGLMMNHTHYLMSELVFQKEFYQISDDNMNSLMIGCYFGRAEYVEYFEQMYVKALKENQVDVASLIKSLRHKDENGRTALDAAEDEINYEKLQTTKQLKEHCTEILENVLNHFRRNQLKPTSFQPTKKYFVQNDKNNLAVNSNGQIWTPSGPPSVAVLEQPQQEIILQPGLLQQVRQVGVY
ncbi:Conserved_hypothetical protein [Hexamita inflata]|uniref:Uncharacterized protein n=1 Tax=Hexamita inflata TaxID=28002 RepID=A0AA86RQF7_9EUKA|nr:Conserved hypothetical protein [Hexamita inflata]